MTYFRECRSLNVVKNGCSSAGVALSADVRYSSTSSFGCAGLSADTEVDMVVAAEMGD